MEKPLMRHTLSCLPPVGRGNFWPASMNVSASCVYIMSVDYGKEAGQRKVHSKSMRSPQQRGEKAQGLHNLNDTKEWTLGSTTETCFHRWKDEGASILKGMENPCPGVLLGYPILNKASWYKTKCWWMLLIFQWWLKLCDVCSVFVHSKTPVEASEIILFV